MDRHKFTLLLSFLLIILVASSGCTSKRELNTRIGVSHKYSTGNLRPAIKDEYSIDDTIHIKVDITGLENDKKTAKVKILYVKIETQNNETIYLTQNDTIEIHLAASFLSGSYSDTFTISARELGEGRHVVYIKAQDMVDGEVKTSSYSFEVKNFFVENLLRNILVIALAFGLSWVHYKKFNNKTFNPNLLDFYKDSYAVRMGIISVSMFILTVFQYFFELRLFNLSSIAIFLFSSLAIPIAIHRQESIKFNEAQERIRAEERKRFEEFQEKMRREYEQQRRQEQEREREEEKQRREREEESRRRQQEDARREREEKKKQQRKTQNEFYRNPKDLSTEELLRIAKIIKQHPTKKDIQKQRRKCAKKIHPDAVPLPLREKALEMMKFYNSVFDELLKRFNYN